MIATWTPNNLNDKSPENNRASIGDAYVDVTSVARYCDPSGIVDRHFNWTGSIAGGKPDEAIVRRRPQL